MTRDDIQRVIDAVPGLTANGIGISPRYHSRGIKPTPEQRVLILDRWRQELLDAEDECTKSCWWLERIEPTQTIRRRWNSYGIKHIAERDIGYVSDGMFIAAAIHSGFAYERMPSSCSVYFNMSERSLNAAMNAVNDRARAGRCAGPVIGGVL